MKNIEDVHVNRVVSRLSVAMYRVCWVTLFVLVRAVFRFRVVGQKNFPDGAFVMSPVHRSLIDTPIAAMTTQRRLRFMGKKSLWDNRVQGLFWTLMGGFPVVRGVADRVAVRLATGVLAQGDPLVMFPEGTRQVGAQLRRADLMDGAAFVAARAGVPIVPVGLGGTAKALPIGATMIRPRKIVAVVGEPVYPPAMVGGRVSRRAVRGMTDRLFFQLSELYLEAQELAAHVSGWQDMRAWFDRKRVWFSGKRTWLCGKFVWFSRKKAWFSQKFAWFSAKCSWWRRQ